MGAESPRFSLLLWSLLCHVTKYGRVRRIPFGRCGSVVERTLGKGEVESSILSSGTTFNLINQTEAHKFYRI